MMRWPMNTSSFQCLLYRKTTQRSHQSVYFTSCHLIWSHFIQNGFLLSMLFIFFPDDIQDIINSLRVDLTTRFTHSILRILDNEVRGLNLYLVSSYGSPNEWKKKPRFRVKAMNRKRQMSRDKHAKNVDKQWQKTRSRISKQFFRKINQNHETCEEGKQPWSGIVCQGNKPDAFESPITVDKHHIPIVIKLDESLDLTSNSGSLEVPEGDWMTRGSDDDSSLSEKRCPMIRVGTLTLIPVLTNDRPPDPIPL